MPLVISRTIKDKDRYGVERSVWAYMKLYMLMTHRCLKSPRSLSGTSTHPTMVTQKSISWSQKENSHPFYSLSISHPIPEMRPFQTLTLKLQCQGHGCGQRARSYIWPRILSIRFLFISHQSDQQFLRYSFFEKLIKVMSEVKGQGHIAYPVSNICTSFSCHINLTNHC